MRRRRTADGGIALTEEETRMIEILKKEVRQFFVTPMGYIIVGIYYFLSSLYFCVVNLSGTMVDLSYVFAFQSNWLLMFLLPMLTMRMLAEERRTKTDQLLLTAPVSVTGIVYGKFLAAFVMFVSCALCNVLFFLIVSTHSPMVLWAEFLCRMLGLLLLGGAILAVDLLISALAENQLIAAFAAMGINILMLVGRSYVATIPSGWRQFAVSLISVFQRFYDTFLVGILNYSSVVYYFSVVMFFLFVTGQVVERRRWS